MSDTRLSIKGKANSAWILFVASLCIFGALVWALLPTRSEGVDMSKPGATAPVLSVFCAPSLKGAVEPVAREYEKLAGIKIELQYQPSQALLTSVEITKSGDIFLPADDSYTEMARKKNLTAESIPIGKQRAVIGVKKGNAKNIKALADLKRAEVKVALAGEAAAIGKLSKEALELIGEWKALADKAVFKGTVNDVANDIKLGSVDAGLIWSTNVAAMADLEGVEDAVLKGIVANVSVSVLKSSKNASAALRFARFLSARDKGLLEFKKAGFEVVDGDAWTASPEIKLFAGAMLRPAIEETLAAFEKREGATVTRVYNGCGILVAQMLATKGGKDNSAMPDAYFACDKSFMKQVADIFIDEVDVSQNQLVILVPKGNPNGIAQLKDLGKPGLRIGVGHEKQCALGALTALTFKTSGVFDGVMKNVKVQSATGDLLVNQLMTGSLDAVVAYISNATGAAGKLEAIKVDIPCALAVQPVAMNKDSTNKQITRRLMEALKSAESREKFLSNGFTWQLQPGGEKK